MKRVIRGVAAVGSSLALAAYALLQLWPADGLSLLWLAVGAVHGAIAALALVLRLIPEAGGGRLLAGAVLTPVPLAVIAPALDSVAMDLSLYGLGWLVPVLLGEGWRSLARGT